MGDPALLASKLREETEELIQVLQTEGAGSGQVDGRRPQDGGLDGASE